MKRNRNRTRDPEVIIHWTKDPLPAEDITTFDGIPVTTPARTLMDLATVESEETIERCLDDALRRKLVSVAFLDRWLDDPRRARHRGRQVLRKLADERIGIGATESPLETQALRLIWAAGLPVPMLQYVVMDGDRFVARVDLAYPLERVAIEVDGFRYHDTWMQFDHERARANDVVALGWTLLRVTARHLHADPDGVVDWIRSALGRAE